MGGGGVLSQQWEIVVEDENKPTADNHDGAGNKPPSAMILGREATNPAAAYQAGKTEHEKKHPLEWAIFVFVVITAVATSAAACFTRQQWLTASDQEHRSLRAYIMLDRAELISVVNDSYTVQINIKNSGQTPGYNVTTWWNWKLLPSRIPDESELRFNDTTLDSVDIAPGQSAPLQPSDGAAPRLISKADMDALVSGTTVLFAWGAIKYRDSFQRCQLTTFRFTSDLQIKSGQLQLTGAAKGNSVADPEAKNCEPKGGLFAKTIYPRNGEVWGP